MMPMDRASEVANAVCGLAVAATAAWLAAWFLAARLVAAGMMEVEYKHENLV